MDLKSLRDKSVEWLKGGPQSDVVVSSRVRLMRNIDGFQFPGRASDQQRARVEELLRNILYASAAAPPLNYFRLGQLNPLMVELLLERRLISREQAEARYVRSVAFDDGEQLSIMVNEEDHLVSQFVRGGLRLEEAFERADRFDDWLAERIPFAFSPHYGYLTASPTNTGTGLRATVLLHLPGIVMAQEMDDVIRTVQERDLLLQGGYGDGAQGAGDLYQVCNRITLGLTEAEIVRAVREGAEALVDRERAAREGLLGEHRAELRDRVQRAYDMLGTAGKLSSEEALSFLSQVRLGVVLDLLGGASMEQLNELFLLTLPAHLQTMEGRELDSSVRNELRASYLRRRLATG
jgi:protein arginine kinase